MAVRCSYFLIVLVLACLFKCWRSEEFCGKKCKDLNDCSSDLLCDPNGECTDNPEFPPIKCPIGNCHPTKTFTYTNDSIGKDRCQKNSVYQYFSCSPPLRNRNFAIFYFIELDSLNVACDKKPHNNSEKLANMATGWFNNGSSCFQNITITALGNGKSTVAQVVDECKSTDGCSAATKYYEPCPPRSIGGTKAVWEALGYHSEGVIQVSWGFSAPQTSRTAVNNIAGLASGMTVLACLVLASIWFWRWKTRERIRKISEKQLVREMRLELLPQQFRYKDLQTATGNFSERFKLGHGGFGTVFKGVLTDGSVVAVKRMDIEVESSHGHSQFKAEIMSIGSIHHFNLVRLRGFCLHGPASMLVYDYMSNGSLDKWIFGLKHGEEFLVWEKRHSIALDVARGLSYLHEEACKEQVLHLDIKPQNILLDENMRARISDFGLCKLAERGKSQAMTVMRGTPGYMAPEWLYTKVTDKTDVYSFGIVMLELITSRRAVEMELRVPSSSVASTLLNAHALGQTASDMYETGNILDLVDPRLLRDSSLDFEGAQRFLKIGLQCIRVDPSERPSIQNVLNMLEDSSMDVLPTSSNHGND